MIGIVTALPKEYAAMAAMLDDGKEYTAPGQGAGRRYLLCQAPASGGGRHRVALALADMGNNTAAIRATRLLEHFPQARHIIMCGIAGGVPNPAKPDEHVRLGDVVVSGQGGVVQYDFDKEEYDFESDKPIIKHRHPPRPPSATLLEAVRLLSASELSGKRPWLAFIPRAQNLRGAARPPDETDVLYASDGSGHIVPHPFDPQRRPGEPRVFLGPVASANKLLKNPRLRDYLRDRFSVRAVEMESSGIADATWTYEVGYLTVRGICDYCDMHKNDAWQGYAAVVAAAYTRALLESMPQEDDDMDRPPEDRARSPKTVFDMRGAIIGKQINVEGDFIDQSTTVIGSEDSARLDRVLEGIDDLKRGQAAIYRRLNQSQRQTVDQVLTGVRAMRLDDAEAAREMRAMLDAIRRGLIQLQSRELPELNAEVRRALDEVTEVLKAGADARTGLELTVPLIPLLLDYKINLDLGGGLDLRQWWEDLRARISGR